MLYIKDIKDVLETRIATSHRPPTACSPTLLRILVLRQTGIQLQLDQLDQLGSTGFNWDQTGSNWDCLIRALFPARFWSFGL